MTRVCFSHPTPNERISDITNAFVQPTSRCRTLVKWCAVIGCVTRRNGSALNFFFFFFCPQRTWWPAVGGRIHLEHEAVVFGLWAVERWVPKETQILIMCKGGWKKRCNSLRVCVWKYCKVVLEACKSAYLCQRGAIEVVPMQVVLQLGINWLFEQLYAARQLHLSFSFFLFLCFPHLVFKSWFSKFSNVLVDLSLLCAEGFFWRLLRSKSDVYLILFRAVVRGGRNRLHIFVKWWIVAFVKRIF